jgi:hypothetical protein
MQKYISVGNSSVYAMFIICEIISNKIIVIIARFKKYVNGIKLFYSKISNLNIIVLKSMPRMKIFHVQNKLLIQFCSAVKAEVL